MKDWNRNISLLLIFLVNALFIVKYGLRITPYAVLIVPFYGLFIYYLNKISTKHILDDTLSKNILLVLIALFTLFCLIGLHFIPKESLNVDRWSVIATFWDTWLNGEYPYNGKSHMGNPPGPLPFYFFIYYPFHVLGEIAWLSIISIIGFLYFLRRLGWRYKEILFGFILLASSPFIYWEIFARSTILTNAMIVAVFLYYLPKQFTTNYFQVFLYGLMGGFVLSTRTVFVIPFIMTCIYLIRFKPNIVRLAFLGIGVSFGFILTWIPILINYFAEFQALNPFIIQSSFFVPSYFNIFFMLIGLFLSASIINIRTSMFYPGICLFLIIFLYTAYHYGHIGSSAIIDSVVDISYFIMAIPFLIIALYNSTSENTTIVL